MTRFVHKILARLWLLTEKIKLKKSTYWSLIISLCLYFVLKTPTGWDHMGLINDFKLHSFFVIQEWESILNSKSWILYLVRKGYSSTRNLFHWEIYSQKSFPISKIQKDSYLLLLFRNSLIYSRVKLCGKVHTHEKYTSWQKHWVNPVCNIPSGIIIIMKTSLEMSRLHTHIDF